MSSIVVWYLVIVFTRGGAVSIPQQSLADCAEHRNEVMNQISGTTTYCIRGAKP